MRPSTITVTNDAPVAHADAYNAVADVEKSVGAPGVLGNDDDADGDDMTVDVVQEPAHGNLNEDDDGSFRYKADDDFAGTDTWRYRVSDGFAWSNTVTVTMTVSGPPATPAPTPDPTPTSDTGTDATTDAATERPAHPHAPAIADPPAIALDRARANAESDAATVAHCLGTAGGDAIGFTVCFADRDPCRPGRSRRPVGQRADGPERPTAAPGRIGAPRRGAVHAPVDR